MTAATIIAKSPDEKVYLLAGRAAEILVCGHSHAYCMWISVHKGTLGEATQRVGVFRGFEQQSNYWDFVVEHSDSKLIAVVWNGNQHNAAFLLGVSPKFSIYDPQVADYEKCSLFLPRSALRAFFEPGFLQLDSLLNKLKARAKQVVLVGTPPPKSRDVILRCLSSEPRFAKSLGWMGPIEEDTISSDSLRVSLWKLIQEMLEARAVRHGISFVAVPTSVMDDDCLLLNEYDNGDATHTNELYGLEMWRQVLKSVGGGGADASL